MGCQISRFLPLDRGNLAPTLLNVFGQENGNKRAEVLPVQYIAEFAAVTVDVRRAARAGAAARHLLIVTFAAAVEQGEHDVVRSGRRGVGEEAHVVGAMAEHDYSGSHDWHAGTSFQHRIWHLPWYRWVRITKWYFPSLGQVPNFISPNKNRPRF